MIDARLVFAEEVQDVVGEFMVSGAVRPGDLPAFMRQPTGPAAQKARDRNSRYVAADRQEGGRAPTTSRVSALRR